MSSMLHTTTSEETSANRNTTLPYLGTCGAIALDAQVDLFRAYTSQRGYAHVKHLIRYLQT
jgi:hypothetical protein